MDTKPCMTRLRLDVSDRIDEIADEKKWSFSSTTADILYEVVIEKRIPSYLLQKM